MNARKVRTERGSGQKDMKKFKWRLTLLHPKVK